ncbi:hypothetical protein IPA_01675 [Ignicoccus pacificus DSM 13166]|uniref:L-fucose isomerase n=1 Tax=Ignicoccus pacificus DSM 13166 TaxID=940294 RepID=A0A977KAJ7_9CREN|nr:hypothetical protein IPA_01675 [Ignicoccus pacificus DSM 13166]
MVSEVSVTTGEVLEGTTRYTGESERLCDEVMIIHVMTGGTEHKVIELYQSCKPKALFITAFPKRNSLPAALEALQGLEKGGLYLVKSDEDLQKVRVMAKRAERFVNSKSVLIGGVAPWLVEVPSRERLEEVFGIRVIDVSIDELITSFENSKVEEDTIKSIKAGASKVEVKDEDLVNALKLRNALEKVIDLVGAKSLAINCFELIKHLGVTPCLPLALLNSANIPSACEGDLLALSGMILSYIAFGKVGGVFNVVDLQRGRVLLAHCTAPLTMLDDYSLVPHYETGAPVAVQGRILPGRDLIALRLSKGLKEAQVWIGKSTVGPRADACRTQVWMEANVNPRGNHRVLVDSSDTRALRAALGAFGIKPPDELYLA